MRNASTWRDKVGADVERGRADLCSGTGQARHGSERQGGGRVEQQPPLQTLSSLRVRFACAVPPWVVRCGSGGSSSGGAQCGRGVRLRVRGWGRRCEQAPSSVRRPVSQEQARAASSCVCAPQGRRGRRERRAELVLSHDAGDNAVLDHHTHRLSASPPRHKRRVSGERECNHSPTDVLRRPPGRTRRLAWTMTVRPCAARERCRSDEWACVGGGGPTVCLWISWCGATFHGCGECGWCTAAGPRSRRGL
jgi:hypothetical protein